MTESHESIMLRLSLTSSACCLEMCIRCYGH